MVVGKYKPSFFQIKVTEIDVKGNGKWEWGKRETILFQGKYKQGNVMK